MRIILEEAVKNWTFVDWVLAGFTVFFFWILLWFQLFLMEARAEKRTQRFNEWQADKRGSAGVEDFERWLEEKEKEKWSQPAK